MPILNLGGSNDVSQEALKERSYLWMARAFGLICVVTLIANLILFAALDSLLPLVRVQPFFITTQDKDKQVIKIVRPSPKLLKSRQLQEAFVRQYLVARLGIGSDVDELERRWGPEGTIQWMSSDSVYNTFVTKRAVGLIKQAREEGLTRTVDILNTQFIPRTDGQTHWKAQVLVTDMSRSASDKQETRWDIDMSINFGRLRKGVSWEQRLQNPLGFRVESFGEHLVETK